MWDHELAMLAAPYRFKKMFNIESRKINPKNLESQLNQLTCIYRNESEFIQIIRISQPINAFFEKAVLQNQCIQFLAPVDALLEVYEGIMCGSICGDTIPCSQLAITTDLGINQNQISPQGSNRDFQAAFAIAA